jgi:hypothetical protein
LPTTSACAATARVTTLPAPIIANGPMSRPHTTVALAPIDAPRPTIVATIVQFAWCARGKRSLVNTALGPTNTSSCNDTPA